MTFWTTTHMQAQTHWLTEHNCSCWCVQINVSRNTVREQINNCLNTRPRCPEIDGWDVIHCRHSLELGRTFYLFISLWTATSHVSCDPVRVNAAIILLILPNEMWTSETEILFIGREHLTRICTVISPGYKHMSMLKKYIWSLLFICLHTVVLVTMH